MTLTLELSSEVEQALTQAAAARGLSLDAYAADVLRQSAQTAEIARLAAIEEVGGKYAHLLNLGVSSTALRQERDAELQREIQ